MGTGTKIESISPPIKTISLSDPRARLGVQTDALVLDENFGLSRPRGRIGDRSTTKGCFDPSGTVRQLRQAVSQKVGEPGSNIRDVSLSERLMELHASALCLERHVFTSSALGTLSDL